MKISGETRHLVVKSNLDLATDQPVQIPIVGQLVSLARPTWHLASKPPQPQRQKPKPKGSLARLNETDVKTP